jgi:hypothetical protein
VQYTSLSWHRRALSLIAGMLLVILNTTATAADIYNPTTHQLTMPLVAIGNATYSNMMVTPANILCAQGGTPNGNEDTYYFNDNIKLPVEILWL